MQHITLSNRDPRDAETPHISVSQAALVERCPLQWRFRYVDKLPVPERENSDNWQLGVAVDAALSAFYSHSHGRAAASEARAHMFRIINTLPAHLQGKGMTAIAQWEGSWVAWTAAQPGGVQRRHSLPLFPSHGGSLFAIGYSDLIAQRADGTGVLIDWKYGGKPNDPAWLAGVARQLRFYAYAETALRITEAYIVRFGGRDLQIIPIDLYDAVGVRDMVDWLYACVERGPAATEHAPTPGAHCGWCPYTAACAAQCAVWARRVGNV